MAFSPPTDNPPACLTTSALYANVSTVNFYLCFANKNIKECGTNETEDAWALPSVGLDGEVSYSVLFGWIFLLEAHTCVYYEVQTQI